jgi:hypothetical protein
MCRQEEGNCSRAQGQLIHRVRQGTNIVARYSQIALTSKAMARTTPLGGTYVPGEIIRPRRMWLRRKTAQHEISSRIENPLISTRSGLADV